METWRRRPPAALKLGGIPAEHSRNVLLELNLANQPISVRHVASAGSTPISNEYIGEISILRQTRNR